MQQVQQNFKFVQSPDFLPEKELKNTFLEINSLDQHLIYKSEEFPINIHEKLYTYSVCLVIKWKVSW